MNSSNRRRGRGTRQNRRRRLNRSRIGLYKDVINVNLPPATSIGYRTIDVRFNSDRAYRIKKVIAWVTADRPTIAQISIQAVNSRLTSRDCASSGPIPVGTIPQRIIVVNRDQEFVPPGNTTDLFNVDHICVSKGATTPNLIGTIHVYIQFLSEMLPESCPTIWTPENHPPAPKRDEPSSTFVESFEKIDLNAGPSA